MLKGDLTVTNKTRRRVVKSMQVLLEEQSKAYKAYFNFINSLHSETPKEKIGDAEYTENMLSEENYHSVVNSGFNIYFEKRTQEELTKLYHYIALHNKRIELMSNIMHLNFQDIKTVWHSHQQQLALYEKELKIRFPVVKKCLEDELNNLKKSKNK